MDLLKGKKALITGSRRGIGAGIARVFAENGADVGINDIERDENADGIIAEIEEMGRTATWHQADIGSTYDRNRMFDEFLDAHGQIDVLVNNAVASADPHFVNITEEFWDFLVGHALKGYLVLFPTRGQRDDRAGKRRPRHLHIQRTQLPSLAARYRLRHRQSRAKSYGDEHGSRPRWYGYYLKLRGTRIH